MSDILNGTEAAEPKLDLRGIAELIFRLTGHRPSRQTLWRWHLNGRLSAQRIGGKLFATKSAVIAMLAADESRNHGSADKRGADAAARLEAHAKLGKRVKRRGAA